RRRRRRTNDGRIRRFRLDGPDLDRVIPTDGEQLAVGGEAQPGHLQHVDRAGPFGGWGDRPQQLPGSDVQVDDPARHVGQSEQAAVGRLGQAADVHLADVGLGLDARLDVDEQQRVPTRVEDRVAVRGEVQAVDAVSRAVRGERVGVPDRTYPLARRDVPQV